MPTTALTVSPAVNPVRPRSATPVVLRMASPRLGRAEAGAPTPARPPPDAGPPDAGPPDASALRREARALVRRLCGAEAARPSAHAIEALLQAVRARAPYDVQARLFDELFAALRGLRHRLAHAPLVSAYLVAEAPLRLQALEAALADCFDPAERAALLGKLLGLRRPPMPTAVVAGAERLLARCGQFATEQAAQAAFAAPHPAAPTLCEMGPALRIVAHNLALVPVRKEKRSPYHQRAHALTQPWRALSTFHPIGRPDFAGVLSPTLQSGSFCKLRLLLRWDGCSFAVRQSPSLPQRSIAPERWFADGARLSNAPLRPLQPQSYLAERTAQTMAASALTPLLSLYDAKQRLFDILPLYDGDLHGLCERYRDGLPAHVLVRCALDVLPCLDKLADYGWQHFDLKPENILWRRDGEVALADYGLTGPAQRQHYLGSDGYFCPHAAACGPAEAHKTDLYALAMTMVHLLDPYGFDDFPLAVRFDAKARSAAEQRATLRASAQRARAAYAAWRQGHDDANGPSGAACVEASAGAANVAFPSKDAGLVEGVYRRAMRRSPLLAKLVFERWANPDPAARGVPGEHAAALQAAYPADDPHWHVHRRWMAAAAASDEHAQRTCATLAAMERFRAAFVAGLARDGVAGAGLSGHPACMPPGRILRAVPP